MMHCVLLTATAILCTTAPAEPAWQPQPEGGLVKMLDITWSRGPNLPQGFQDSNGGVVDGFLVSAAGFCSGKDNDRKPGRYPRGFLKKVWALELANEAGGWKDLPEFPGAARQGLATAVAGGVLYAWGGFSYSEPYCYADGWRLSKQASTWVWEPLPPLPVPLCGTGCCTIGTTIYLFGGADYDAEKFYTVQDRKGEHARLGAQLLAFDTLRPSDGWKTLPPCPGTPRWVAALAVARERLFVIGGATGDPYATVVDNWAYDPGKSEWTRLRDLPIASGNFPAGQIVFRSRFVILGGGYQYGKVANPDGTFREPYGTPHRFNDKGDYYNDMFVYDIETDLFGRADSMPLNNNLSMMLLQGDTLYLIGGETGSAVVEGEFYGHHPDLCLKGRIAEAGTPAR